MLRVDFYFIPSCDSRFLHRGFQASQGCPPRHPVYQPGARSSEDHWGPAHPSQLPVRRSGLGPGRTELCRKGREGAGTRAPGFRWVLQDVRAGTSEGPATAHRTSVSNTCSPPPPAARPGFCRRGLGPGEVWAERGGGSGKSIFRNPEHVRQTQPCSQGSTPARQAEEMG